MTLTRLLEPKDTVRHVDGGQGTVVLVHLSTQTRALVEWEDLSRTWEDFKDLEGPLQ